jgi:hypothetical protein
VAGVIFVAAVRTAHPIQDLTAAQFRRQKESHLVVVLFSSLSPPSAFSGALLLTLFAQGQCH